MSVSVLPSRFAEAVARFFSSVLGRFIVPMTMVYAGLALLCVNHFLSLGNLDIAVGLMITGTSLSPFLLLPLQRNAREYRWLEPVADLLRLPGSDR